MTQRETGPGLEKCSAEVDLLVRGTGIQSPPVAQVPTEEWTLDEAVREIGKLRRENARLRIYVRDLKALAGVDVTTLHDGARRLRGMLRDLQLKATQGLDALALFGLPEDDDE